MDTIRSIIGRDPRRFLMDLGAVGSLFLLLGLLLALPVGG